MPKKPINIQIVDLLSAEILQKHFNQISSMQQDEFGIESWNFNMLERYLKHLQNYPHPKKITPVNSNKLKLQDSNLHTTTHLRQLLFPTNQTPTLQ